MDRGKRTLIALAALVFLVSGTALAYKPNPDTAPNRQDEVIGTRRPEGSEIIMQTDPKTGDRTIDAIPREKEQDQNQNMNIGPVLVVPKITP